VAPHPGLPESATRPYAFLSYASADRERALGIADLLEQHQTAVWIDRRSIAGDASWSAEIVRGVRGCTAFVVLCSPASMASENVQQEIQLAWESKRRILPLLLQPMEMPETIAYALAGRQWVELLDRPQQQWLPDALRALTGLGIAATSDAPPPALAPPPPAAVPDQPPAGIAPVPGRRDNLPATLTSFIGRERELSDIGALLDQARLVTLVGVGGTGKTRLALEVARGLLATYPDGVWLVELAALADPGLAPETVISALGLAALAEQGPVATLLQRLQSKQLLLILDNCEHLLDACAQLADALLRSCPTVSILATSREALGIAGEVSWRVPSLETPDPAHLPPLPNVEPASGRPPLRRARPGSQPAFHADRAARGGRGRHLPAAGWHPAGHRVGGGAGAGAGARATRQPVGPALPPLDRRQSCGAAPAADVAGAGGLELSVTDTAGATPVRPAVRLRRRLHVGGGGGGGQCR